MSGLVRLDPTYETVMNPASILETVLYAADLDAARAFYAGLIGLDLYSEVKDRHVFFHLGGGMLLIFNPDATEIPARPGALPVPPHGARGPGHVCFSASAGELDAWRAHLTASGIGIESEFTWPNRDAAKQGRSIYIRDPAGNSVEFAEPRIWGIDEA
jgi:catechol 2,3-dioxygenase-like lactoylglutathione lyase family enzyme